MGPRLLNRTLTLLVAAALVAACDDGSEDESPPSAGRLEVSWIVQGLAREPGCGTGTIRACLGNRGDGAVQVTEADLYGATRWTLEGPAAPFLLQAGEEACFQGRLSEGAEPAFAELTVRLKGRDAPLTTLFEAPACEREPARVRGLQVRVDAFGADRTCATWTGEACLANQGAAPVYVSDVDLSLDPAWEVLASPAPYQEVASGDEACVELRVAERAAGVRAGDIRWWVEGQDAPVVARVEAACDRVVDVAFPSAPLEWETEGCIARADLCVRNDGPEPLPFLRFEVDDPSVWNVWGGEEREVAPGETLCATVQASGPGARTTEVRLALEGNHAPLRLPLTVEAPAAYDRTESFQIPDPPSLDVVWVVDDAPALDGVRAPAELAAAFVQALEGTDARVAVVSTDPEAAGAPVLDDGGDEPFLPLALPDAESRLAARLSAVDGPDTPNEALVKAAQALARLFPWAAWAPVQPSGPNTLLLFTTASDDVSPWTVEDAARILTEAWPPTRDAAPRLALFSGAPGDPDPCAGPPPERLAEVVSALLGQTAEVCALAEQLDPADWTRPTRLTPMRSPADPASLTLHRTPPDGTTFEVPRADWAWIASEGAVVFGPSAVPEPGDRIDVTERVACTEVMR